MNQNLYGEIQTIFGLDSIEIKNVKKCNIGNNLLTEKLVSCFENRPENTEKWAHCFSEDRTCRLSNDVNDFICSGPSSGYCYAVLREVFPSLETTPSTTTSTTPSETTSTTPSETTSTTPSETTSTTLSETTSTTPSITTSTPPSTTTSTPPAAASGTKYVEIQSSETSPAVTSKGVTLEVNSSKEVVVNASGSSNISSEKPTQSNGQVAEVMKVPEPPITSTTPSSITSGRFGITRSSGTSSGKFGIKRIAEKVEDTTDEKTTSTTTTTTTQAPEAPDETNWILIGILLGIIVGLPLIVGGIWFFFFRKKKIN